MHNISVICNIACMHYILFMQYILFINMTLVLYVICFYFVFFNKVFVCLDQFSISSTVSCILTDSESFDKKKSSFFSTRRFSFICVIGRLLITRIKWRIENELLSRNDSVFGQLTYFDKDEIYFYIHLPR